ncbi:hypothetical protein OC845_000126 [Tilletia horrida]|nr:hypothetical protein OC845_000126 [Tilletia horrida]
MDAALPSRKSHDLPITQFRTAASLAGVLTSALQSMLAEADSYAALYESRIKLEENFISTLRSAIEKQNEVDGKAEAKSPSSYSVLFGSGSATLRASWREVRENQSREIEMRQSLAENLRYHVIGPLQAFRESQERIRRRVKEDLKASLADYDQMRDTTLPRLRKVYEKKCEQLEGLQNQQQAIDDQRALLSQPPSSQQVPTLGTLPNRDSVGADELAETAAPQMSKSGSQQSGPDQRGYSPGSYPADASGAMRSDANFFSTSPSSPPSASNKVSLRDALRTKEGREAAIKDAPKKLQGFINRMREGASEKHNQFGASARDRDGSSDAFGSLGTSTEHGPPSLVRGASAAKTIQNLALRLVQIKKESEEADRAYRKAVFDLETLRIRRSKTLAAAVTSVVECRRELNRTAQLVFLTAERAALSTAHASVSVHDRTEGIVEHSTQQMAIEVIEMESGLTAVISDDEETVPYINYWHGEARVIFGISLTDYAFSHFRSRVTQPPVVVTKCISYIEKHGLEQQGIYRISARHSSIQALASAVEKNEEGLDLEVMRPDIPTVAGLLKLYLRQLPEPVMTMPFEERIKYTHEREEHIRSGFATLKGRIRRLPLINNVTLKAIIFHLANVAAHSDKNSMTESNLAVIFGPVLLSEVDHETTTLASAMEEDRVVEDLIKYAPQIFEAGPVDPNAPATTTTSMAHGASLLTQGGDSAPSIAIPAVPLSTDLSGFGTVSSSSNQPLLPGAAGLKRSNAITPGDTVSPPRREIHLHSLPQHTGLRSNAPTLPPVRTSPLAPLSIDPIQQAGAALAAKESGITESPRTQTEQSEWASLSRATTLRQPEGNPSGSHASHVHFASEPGSADVSQYATPLGIPSAGTLQSSTRSSSTSSFGNSVSAPDPWSSRGETKTGGTTDSPSLSSSSSGFSVGRRPLPVPQVKQLATSSAMDLPASGLDGPQHTQASPSQPGTLERASTAPMPVPAPSSELGPIFPPPVSDLIFTRPPPPLPQAAMPGHMPPLPPRPRQHLTSASQSSIDVDVNSLTNIQLERE